MLPAGAPVNAAEQEQEHPVFAVARRPQVAALIERILKGEEPWKPRTDLPPNSYQIQRYTSQHVHMVLLRVAGFRKEEIAEMCRVSRAVVRYTLEHPLSQKLMATMFPQVVDQTLDMRNKLARLSDAMVGRLATIALSTPDEALATKITFGLLDRTGFGPAQKITASVEDKRLSAPAAAVSRLSAALEGSKRVDSILDANYRFKPAVQGSEAVPPHGSSVPGQSGPAGGGVGSPHDDSSDLDQPEAPRRARSA